MQAAGGVTGVLLDLNFMRLYPSSLEDVTFLKYFAALNNCRDPLFGAKLDSEFDFPKIATFYKERASRIVSVVPTTIRVHLWDLLLGEYDQVKKSFPFKIPRLRNAQELVIDHVDPISERLLTRSVCGPAASRTGLTYSGVMSRHGPVYQIAFKQLIFSEIPVSEDAARAYVHSLSQTPGGRAPLRQAQVVGEFDILPQEPQVLPNQPDQPMGVVFAGEVKKISVLRPNKVSLDGKVIPGDVLSVLYQ